MTMVGAAPGVALVACAVLLATPGARAEGMATGGPLTGLVVLLRFPEQAGTPLPPPEFVAEALNYSINDWYNQATKWQIRPMRFLVTEYYTPSRSFLTYDWWSKPDTWENHYDLLRDVADALAAERLMVRDDDGALRPVDLSLLSHDETGRVLSIGTTYYAAPPVFGRAVGNEDYWPQSDETQAAILRKWGCRLGSFSSGFLDRMPGDAFDDYRKLGTGAYIHEVGHAFFQWPDVYSLPYGVDAEIIKRLSTANKLGPSAVTRELNGLPNGSTVTVSAGDWDVWAYRNPRRRSECIAFDNIAAKGYTRHAAAEHGEGLAVQRIDTDNPSQQLTIAGPRADPVACIGRATWTDGTPVGFSISRVATVDGEIVVTIRTDVEGEPRACGPASGHVGYPVRLLAAGGDGGPVGYFADTKYTSRQMSTMGMEAGSAMVVEVHPGFEVRLYARDDFAGDCVTLRNASEAIRRFELAPYGIAGALASLWVRPLGP